MPDQPKQGGQERPALSQLYTPPEDDSWFQVRFAGNTAQIVALDGHHTDPFQLLAASKFIERSAMILLAQSEEAALRKAQMSGIAVAGRIPDQAKLPGE